MSQQDARDRLAAALRHGLARAASESEPIDYDTLEAYVDERLDAADREIVDSRLADDDVLRAEVEELCALRDALGAPLNQAPSAERDVAETSPAPRVTRFDDRRPKPAAARRSPFSVSPAFAAAASVILVLGTGLVWWIRSGNVSLDGGRPVASGGAAGSATAAAPAAAAPAAAPGGEVVRDGRHVVTLTADSGVAGLDGLDPALRTNVAEMLATGRLPAGPPGLSAPAGQLLSTSPRGGPGAAVFSARAPVGTAVREAQPLFQWTPADGATAYRVRVVDAGLELVAQSEAVTATTWRPSRPLPRGKVLQWQVEAIVSSGHLLAPVPPAPEARFRVLTDAEDKELTRALAASGDSSLAALSLYTAAGLRTDARRVINGLVSANPNSPLLQRLYADLRRR